MATGLYRPTGYSSDLLQGEPERIDFYCHEEVLQFTQQNNSRAAFPQQLVRQSYAKNKKEATN